MSVAAERKTQDALKKSSFASVTALIGLQLFSRLFTFILNQSLIRMTSPEIFGAAAIQFELILSTILFLSREGVRTTILRVQNPSRLSPKELNLSFVPIGVGIPLATAIAWSYARCAGEQLRNGVFFREAVGVYACAAVLELLTEPFHNLSMIQLKTNIRVKAEGTGVCITSSLYLRRKKDARKDGQGRLALLAFALGQLAYSLACLVVYAGYFGAGTLRPQTSGEGTGFVDIQLFKLSATMTWQSIIKHVLTEGDKLVLSWFSPLQDQGGYALAVNYGSLIARILFQPIEEVMRFYFSKTFAQGTKPSQTQSALKDAANALISLVSVQLELSLFFLVFGTAYLPVLLPILLPPRYMATSAPQILAAWIWYIPVLAVNGGLEGFVASVASTKDLNIQSRWMVAFSCIFLATAVSLYRLGAGDASLVYANIVNLLARIVFGVVFAKSFFVGKGAGDLFSIGRALPPISLLIISFAMWSTVSYDGKRRNVENIVRVEGRGSLLNVDVVQHVGIGSALALVWLSYWWLSSGHKRHWRP
ncbi:Oligosaccharide translocation protein RFT1 [Leucoagaricus sp. SymC.cos]|nr:Oligosaccharide translocation protein RFT1 [Leucoagaricus sp. SymC.cos]